MKALGYIVAIYALLLSLVMLVAKLFANAPLSWLAVFSPLIVPGVAVAFLLLVTATSILFEKREKGESK